MHAPLTYELRIQFQGEPRAAIKTKENLTDWLLLNGVESFVDGELAVDINQNQDEPPRDYYHELGGDLTPVSVYRYSLESLTDLKTKLEHTFRQRVVTEIHEMATEVWMEGWKESFKPFATDVFYVRPPWEAKSSAAGLKDLVIEPGMAFGTGQHATTRLCLEEASGRVRRSGDRVLDVGTGTGILAIGAKLLGYDDCLGTDIEDDAILAAKANATLNGVSVSFRLGSMPSEAEKQQGYDLVFANILAVVLLRIMNELSSLLKPGGTLILSGLLVEEEPEIIARAEAFGLRYRHSRRLDGWAAVVCEKS